MPGSFPNFKSEIIRYLTRFLNGNSTILDVGPGCGTYYDLLGGLYKNIDCVEIYQPYIEKFNLKSKYRNVFNENIVTFDLKTNYDVIIMGDILEHLSITDAQLVIEKLYNRCNALLVVVPYSYVQGIYDNNIYEVHIQDDLTPELMEQRYPKLTCMIRDNTIGVYIKR